MPETPTTNMLLVKPTEGSDSGSWDAEVNDALDLIDAHDHSSGKGVTVKTAGLSINADLTFTTGGTANAAKDLKAVDFAPSAASGMTAYAGALFCNSDDSNNLYWRTTSGSNVKLTSGASLNVAAFVGGIGGDYSSVSALVDYTDGSDKYMLRQEVNTAVRQYAKLECADLKLFEYHAAGVTPVTPFGVTLKSPAALAADYSITMPGAAPGSTSLVQMSSAGVLTASNTVGNAVSMSSTLGVTGLITATAGLTAAANQHVTVSGTGDIKHGDRIKNISLFSGSGNMTPGTASIGATAGSQTWTADTTLRVGDRIKTLQFFFDPAGTSLISFQLNKRTIATGASSATTVASGSSSAGGAHQSVTVSSINYTLVTTEDCWLAIVSGQNADVFTTVVVTYDHP
jgi:hypothetical protein